MKVKTLAVAVLLFIVASAIVHFAVAQEPAQVDPATDMEAMMKLAEPGPEHAELAKLVGQWETKMAIQMQMDAPPMESTATGSARMILGGRFLEIVSTGSFMDMDVESRTIIGFDRRHEEYTFVGLDTLGTYWVTAKGKRGEDGVIRMRGSDDDPMGQQIYAFEYEILGEDEYMYRVIFEQIGPQKYDPPLTMMKAHNTRKK
jgi:hypothetical protein